MKARIRLTALFLALCLCMSFAACHQDSGKPDPTDTVQPSVTTTGQEQNQNYSITLTSQAGTAFAGVGVYVYEDETAQELVWFARTDASGTMTFTAPAAQGYVAVLEGMPEGYALEAQYPLTGLETKIVLASQVISGDITGQKFSLGDVMWDLTVTDLTGKTYQISQLLEEKNAVMLNFWYLDCTPCRQEFPYLQKAYEENSDTIGLLALNCMDTDKAAMEQFVQELGLTMPVAQCGREVSDALSLVGYPATIVIDRYGIISAYHVGGIDSADAFADVMNFFTSDSYQQTLVEDINTIITPEDNEKEEVINNPTSVGGVEQFQLTVRAGETVYCDIYRADDMYLTIQDETAELLYNGKTYSYEYGRVRTTLYCKDTFTPTTIALKNLGTETTTYTLKLSAKAGSLNNPYRLQLGEFDVDIPSGKEEGVYYVYTAPADGYLIMQCLSATPGKGYGYNLYNLNNYAMRNLESDAVLDSNGNVVVRIVCHKGQRIQFNPSALPDDSGNYPSIQMRFLASFKEGLDADDLDVPTLVYAVSVVDGDRQPLVGVPVTIETEKGPQNLVTNDKGTAAAKLPVGEYKATVRVPVGYTGRVTQLTLTEAVPTQAIKLDAVVDTTKTYTVTVTDDQGAPLENVLVTVGEKAATTNASGQVSFPLAEGSYTALIGVPEGYTSGSISFPFPQGQTELTVVLTKGSSGGEEDKTVEYSVKVTDYDGKALAGVTVSFLSEGNVVALQPVDSEGNATVKLAPGSYTASLAFSSGAYFYDSAALTLTQEAPSVTVAVIAKRGDVYTELYVGDAYYVNAGATYIEGMDPKLVNYFIYKPTVSGCYRITTTDPAAVVSYWGANVFYIADQTGAVKDGDNALALEIREEYLNEDTLYILGITGSDKATLLVERTGDVILTEEEKAEWIEYEAKEPPQKFQLTLNAGEELTYLDLKSKSIVYVKGADGYYHLNDENGPILYVNLGTDGRYMPYHAMLGFEQAGGTNFQCVFYDDAGNFIKKENYTACMQSFVKACVDSQGYGVYPLNDDLIYMIQNGGKNKGWYDPEGPSFLFGSSQDLNLDILWMFSVMYITK